eukprot:6275215-Amphidinium_carterae.3
MHPELEALVERTWARSGMLGLAKTATQACLADWMYAPSIQLAKRCKTLSYAYAPAISQHAVTLPIPRSRSHQSHQSQPKGALRAPPTPRFTRLCGTLQQKRVEHKQHVNFQ